MGIYCREKILNRYELTHTYNFISHFNPDLYSQSCKAQYVAIRYWILPGKNPTLALPSNYRY